jgi:hypothetical protein
MRCEAGRKLKQRAAYPNRNLEFATGNIQHLEGDADKVDKVPGGKVSREPSR